MILKILVENYFERNGTFSGIEKSCISEALAAVVGTHKISTYCSDLLQLQTDKETAVSTSKNTGLINLVGKFYSLDQSNLIMSSQGPMPFCLWLQLNNRKSVTAVLSEKGVKDCLLKFASIESLKYPMILHQTLITPKPLSSREQESIQKKGLEIAMYKKSPLKKYLLKMPAELLTMSVNNPEIYKEVLNASVRAETAYQDFVSPLGYKVPDLLEAWRKTGQIFAKSGDDIIYLTRTGWKICPEFEFVNYVKTSEPLDLFDSLEVTA